MTPASAEMVIFGIKGYHILRLKGHMLIWSREVQTKIGIQRYLDQNRQAPKANEKA